MTEVRGGPPAAVCARCASPYEPGDLRCAICGLPAPPPVRRDDAGEGEAPHAEILRCRGCGAAVGYDVAAQAPRCGFCGAVMEVERPLDPIEEAEAFLPFRLSEAEAKAALRSWLGRQGFFRPSDLASAAVLDSLLPLWFAAWVVEAQALVSWTADSDAGARRAAWAPHAGQAPLRVDALLVSASRGLTHAEVAGLAPAYRLDSAAPTPEGPPGARVERFDVQRSAARSVLASALRHHAEAEARAAWIPGSRHRNVKVEVLLRRMATRRLALPAWVLAYRYRGALYRAVVHGQDGSVVVGRTPLSWWKVLLVAAAVLALVTGLALLLFYFL
ncbi:MAG: zinc ribbon domain-containing protein [Deltaproteobacteria bacterium]|nr:MAG: zinc ribbon domain-containing protein [Deltaproteobacteria bacterium]